MKITKEQFQQLSPEQQEALASMELQRAKKRLRLLEEVRGRAGMRSLPSLFAPFVMLILIVSMFLTEESGLLTDGWYAPTGILCLAMIPCFYIQVQVALQNRRLDALVEVLEEERKESDPSA
jgi:hypothetical protein